MREDISKNETIKDVKNSEETTKDVVPDDELYESSSESDQETEIVKESECGLGALDLGGVESESGFGASNLGSAESECGPGSLNFGGVEENSRRSLPILAPTNLSLGAVPRKFTHSSASSTSTLPVSPPSGFFMDPAPSAEVGTGGGYNMEDFGKQEELLFPSTSPVLTSTISSTLFASSISSLRFYQDFVNSLGSGSLFLS